MLPTLVSYDSLLGWDRMARSPRVPVSTQQLVVLEILETNKEDIVQA